MICFFLGYNLLLIKSNLHLGRATQYGINLAQKGRVRHQREMGFSVRGGCPLSFMSMISSSFIKHQQPFEKKKRSTMMKAFGNIYIYIYILFSACGFAR